ncbi:OsmC family protein [Candidatus Accumulibacter sp. ACC003]|uniref:OsmC family protein n=1 Tax=Candidatus Accumulibacter sp. ACC003 TaxID=2823334 RepID=UPI0025B8EFFC|nr:OsmC family protein [Candidatus Accumulibacter sp. ACC003]
MKQQTMQAALQRAEHIFLQRPEAAQRRTIARASVRDGMRCEFSEDQWRFVADMPEAIGGSATGATPSTLARAALSTCLAIGYAMRAAYLGVAIRGVEVELRAEADLRGLFCGQAEVPNYRSLAYLVTFDSDASDSELQRVLDEADERSPDLQLFTKPQSLSREMRVIRTAAA